MGVWLGIGYWDGVVVVVVLWVSGFMFVSVVVGNDRCLGVL